MPNKRRGRHTLRGRESALVAAQSAALETEAWPMGFGIFAQAEGSEGHRR
jgi:hypothetical protein